MTPTLKNSLILVGNHSNKKGLMIRRFVVLLEAALATTALVGFIDVALRIIAAAISIATGKYLITTNVKLAYNGVISATNRTVTLKLRRTNNTAADLSNSTTTFVTQVVSLVGLTGTAGDCDVPALIYNGTSGDTIEMQGQISSVSGLTGSMDVQEASIVATRIN